MKVAQCGLWAALYDKKQQGMIRKYQKIHIYEIVFAKVV